MPTSPLRFVLGISLALLPLLSTSACKITTCEEGATCEPDDDDAKNASGGDDGDHACPSDPSPGQGSSAASGSGSSSGGGSGEGGGAGEGGGGGATACEKSCECPEGESCVDGWCALPEPDPEPATCVDDCDCPSGQVCTSGTCG